MRGLHRLSNWLRPSDTGARHADMVGSRVGSRVGLRVQTASAAEGVDSPDLAQHAQDLDEAIVFMTATQDLAVVNLRETITQFRAAFEAPARDQKTLDRAWHVQQAWHKVRTIEASLRILSKERKTLTALLTPAPQIGETGPDRPTHAGPGRVSASA